MKKISLIAVLLSTMLFSCKKDDEKCELSQSAFVGSYKVTALKYKASTSTPEIDEFAILPACEKDDVITFNSNGSSTYTDAGTVCVPDGNDTGTWSLTGSTMVIDTQIATVTYFDCNGTTFTFAGTVAGELTTVSLARQ